MKKPNGDTLLILFWLFAFLLVICLGIWRLIKEIKKDEQAHEQTCLSYQECVKEKDPETCIKWINLDIRNCEGVIK